MRRAVVLLLVVLAACGNASSARTPPASAPPPASDGAAPEAPEDALKRQLTELAQGQFGLAYLELHPAQQAAFTKEIYNKCKSEGPSLEIKKIDVVTTYSEAVDVPGTDVKGVDSTAVTVKLMVSINGGPDSTQTVTLHEFLVEGSWKFSADDSTANAYKRGACS